MTQPIKYLVSFTALGISLLCLLAYGSPAWHKYIYSFQRNFYPHTTTKVEYDIRDIIVKAKEFKGDEINMKTGTECGKLTECNLEGLIYSDNLIDITQAYLNGIYNFNSDNINIRNGAIIANAHKATHELIQNFLTEIRNQHVNNNIVIKNIFGEKIFEFHLCEKKITHFAYKGIAYYLVRDRITVPKDYVGPEISLTNE